MNKNNFPYSIMSKNMGAKCHFAQYIYDLWQLTCNCYHNFQFNPSSFSHKIYDRMFRCILLQLPSIDWWRRGRKTSSKILQACLSKTDEKNCKFKESINTTNFVQDYNKPVDFQRTS